MLWLVSPEVIQDKRVAISEILHQDWIHDEPIKLNEGLSSESSIQLAFIDRNIEQIQEYFPPNRLTVRVCPLFIPVRSCFHP